MANNISVVMTSYNGEKYIKRQLDSLLAQNCQADEVIICDDCSTDTTAQIVQDYIDEHGLDNWHIYVNSSNLGWRKNFVNGILKAKGEVIFLSDQDDEWSCEKIGEMYSVMCENRDIEVLACNFTPVYEDNTQPRVKTGKGKYGKKLLEKVELNGGTFRPIRPGCSYAMRRSIVPKLEKLWFDGCAHDSMIWGISIVEGTLYIYNRSMMKQYRHAGNSTPLIKERGSEGRIENIRFRKKLALLFLDKIGHMSPQNRKWLSEYVKVVDKRVNYMESGNMLIYIALLKDIRYYPKFASWLGDLKANLSD